ncbi:MAG: DUF6525 family protein [Pikeienuella sp.]|uniref:DUF6525 family protein n=1 Tax=Pikeienuella sp. TaxID=2831957 RepID=UPI00391ADFD9
MRAGNLGAAGLKRRLRARDPMWAYDRLPAPLRRWLSEAALPWSPASAARAFARALREEGGEAAALARLDRIERATLARAALTPPSSADAPSPPPGRSPSAARPNPAQGRI